MSELCNLVKSIALADTLPTNCEMIRVDLLWANDYYLDMFLSQKIEVLLGLYLLSSKLGWILAGRVISEDNKINKPGCVAQSVTCQVIDASLTADPGS